MQRFRVSGENTMTDTDLEKIFKNSISFPQLPDDITKKAVKEFVAAETVLENKKKFLTYFLQHYPKSVSVKDFTPEILKETAGIWNRGFRKRVIDFLIFAQQKGYNTNEKIHRFTYFAGYSGRLTVRAHYIFKVLDDDDFELFASSKKFNELGSDTNKHPVMNVFCFEPSNLHLVDDKARPDMLALFHWYKYESDYSSIHLYNMLPALDNTIAFLFRDSPELTLSKVEEYIALVPENTGVKTSRKDSDNLHSLHEILEVYYKNGLVENKYLKTIAELNKGKNVGCQVLQLRNILASEHPEYYALFFPTADKGKGYSLVLYINHPVLEIRKLLLDFVTYQYPGTFDKGARLFIESFVDSLQDIEITTPADFNYRTFTTQMFYYGRNLDSDSIKSHSAVSAVIAFYLYLVNNVNDDIFSDAGIPSYILNSINKIWLLLDGYEIIKYNQFEDVPDADRWLLIFKNRPTDRIFTIRNIDFTRIKSRIYRDWLKSYIWNEGGSKIKTRLHQFSVNKEVFNYLCDLKTGRTSSLYQARTVKDESHVTAADALAIVNYAYEHYDNPRSQTDYVYLPRCVLVHVRLNNLGTIDAGVFENLQYTREDANISNPISEEELEKLFKVINSRVNEAEGDERILYEIYRAVASLAMETEFRASHILGLTIDSLQETTKKGEYTIYSPSKTHDEPEEQPITVYAAKELQHIISITETFRERSTQQHTKDFIFIGPKAKKNTYGLIKDVFVNRFIQESCRTVGIPEYTLENFRDTHITMAEEFKIYNNLTDLQQTALTGHTTTETDSRHYVRHDKRKMLEAVHGIIIGNVTFEGKICRDNDDSIVSDENRVEGGCGYCSSPKCDVTTPLGCLMCRDFVTMPRCLPFYEQQIKTVDARIVSSSVPHDKEDYVNIKRLLVRYKEELIAVQEGADNEQS